MSTDAAALGAQAGDRGFGDGLLFAGAYSTFTLVERSPPKTARRGNNRSPAAWRR